MPARQETDEHYMQHCIELARKAEGRSSPNPLVGAVVLDKTGTVVGEGFHPKAGQPHAEVFALDAAGDKAQGGTIYVNLEPCCHFGKTPPCADRVIASGVKRVVYGLQDPNPKVLGGGLEKLRQAGIQVDGPCMEAECAKLNRAFIKRIKEGMPWLALKMASTLDGRIADRDGKSQWITGEESRKYVHQLRNRFDCVLVGTNTVIQDNPSLTVRSMEGSRDPHRAIIDANLRIPPSSKVFECSESVRTFLFTSEENILGIVAHENRTGYDEKIELLGTDIRAGRIQLEDCLKQLSSCGVLTVLCEGGSSLAASLLEANLVDELFWFCAPKLLIDGKALSSLNGSARSMDNIIELTNPKYRQLGQDLLIHIDDFKQNRSI